MFSFNGPTVTEIAPDVYRIGVYAPASELQFNFFLVRDDQPLLFTTGFRATFPVLREAVTRVIDPARIRWVGFSHFESDECGALNLWLEAAPHAEPVCSFVGAAVNVNDFASRPPKAMADGEVLATGRYRFRFARRPRFPTAGMPASSSRKRKRRFSARTLPSVWRCRTADGIRPLGPGACRIEPDAGRTAGELYPVQRADGGDSRAISRLETQDASHHARVQLYRRWRTRVARLGGRYAGDIRHRASVGK